MDSHHLMIPLPLAELLFVTLGPLAETLEQEGHRWSSLVKMVLRAYMDGRDDMIMKMYGVAVVKDIDLVTVAVSNELADWVDEMTSGEADFEKWAEEMKDGNEATDTDDE